MTPSDSPMTVTAIGRLTHPLPNFAEVPPFGSDAKNYSAALADLDFFAVEQRVLASLDISIAAFFKQDTK